MVEQNPSPNGRGIDGKFMAGNGAAVGRRSSPLQTRMQELRRVLIGCVTEEEIRAMGRLLLKRFAEEGDLASGKLLLEYACGKPTQAIELSGPNGQPLGIEVLMTAVLAALAPFPEARLAVAATLKSIPPAPDQAEHEHDDTAPQP